MNAGVTIASLLAEATQRIATANALEPREARLEARVLLAQALNVDHAWLIGHDRDIPTSAQQHRIAQLVHRRTEGEPVAYILGEREFYGRRFKVTPDVLIPRPDTELLVDAALERLPQDRPARILDLGTGSGCIAISLALERPGCHITAVDISPAALAVATQNAAELGAQVHFLLSNWFNALPALQYDLIVSNPPYIEQDDTHLRQGDLLREPTHALASGKDGLVAIRQIAADSPRFLLPGGALLLEHGWLQSEAVQSLLSQAGYRRTVPRQDLSGIRRIVIADEFSSESSNLAASR
jgi:release factor glutamine methyltransferase